MNALDVLPENEILECLTGPILVIAETLSVVAAISLINEFGGCQISVPAKYSDGHKLENVLGRENFIQLIDIFKREEIEIPVALKLKRRVRNIQIVNDRKEGKNIPEIARKHKVTTRFIRMILRKDSLEESNTTH